MRIILHKEDLNYHGQELYERGEIDKIGLDSFKLRVETIFNSDLIEFIEGSFHKVLKDSSGLLEGYVF